MDLLVRGNDISISDDLRQYAVQRLAKLDRLVEHVVDAKLELKHQRQRTNGNGAVVAQLTIQTGRDLLRAEERDQDARKAIDLVADKMASQVRKVHDRRSSRKQKRTDLATAPVVLEAAPVATLPLEEDEVVVRTKRFTAQAMDPEEAIEQMELLGHDFFVFQNPSDGTMNVVYRRRDGAYGLLVPQNG